MEVTTSERHASGGEAPELPAQNLVKAFYQVVDRLGDDPAIIDEARGKELSWNELRETVHRIAGGLAELGVEKGDTVAIMLGNRWEFIPADLGAVSLGAIPFSIYQTYAPEQIEYLLSDANSKLVITEQAYLDHVNEARKGVSTLERVVVVDGEGGDLTLDELMQMDPGFDPAESVAEIEPDDLLTLIYTSGTTGPPKGVQLTHRNLLFAVATADEMIDLPERGGKVISWLPAAHVAERNAHYYLPVTKGVSVAVCADPRRIAEYLPKVNPTWFFAVPRIFEKLKSGLEAMIAGLPDEQREAVEKGLEASLQKVRLEQAGEEVPGEIAEAAAQAEEQMFSQLRKQLGLDEAVAVNAGAAPTPLEVLEFFHAIGIPIGELWGMSETCGLGTINPPDRIKLGTVGPPTPGIEIRLDDDGEVLIQADCVMPGYRNLPDKNDEAFTEDGWLRTGDIGEIDEDGYLKIVDRKKELIINAAGKNMSPANIEAHLKTADPLIGQACAIGNGRPYNVALIVLDPDYAPVWAKQNGLEGKSFEELAGEERVREAVQAAVDKANAKMARVEQIKKFTILHEPWEPGGDELTPTMKLKRKPIDEKYAEEIESLYSG
ncbi:MAG TPA: AMP-dependent synthetase/ligase [Solirubrobacterales bacterium]|nr:AMP-dependent synthetase/ligase [Solirubrobacterales bacterium]